MSDARTRRQFVRGAAGAGVLVAGLGTRVFGAAEKRRTAAKGAPEDVAPPEDLMREHGVLNRILLIYDESARRLDAEHTLPADALAKSADLIRRFIEHYHEKLEEDFLFPRFEKAGKLVDLVATLRRQHEAGRTVTATILRLAATAPSGDDRHRLADALRAFIRMYRPHEAREDTVLFPAFRTIVSAKEFHDLGERFEGEEHERFGNEGFEGVVAQVADLERAFGIFELNQFTPVALETPTPPAPSP